MNISKTFALWLLAAGLIVTSAQIGHAQNTNTAQSENTVAATADQGAKAVVLPGCLEQGSGADEYALFGPSVQWWELKSDSVDLAFFLNEEIKVNAVRSPSGDGTLVVTDLTLVSPSCLSW